MIKSGRSRIPFFENWPSTLLPKFRVYFERISRCKKQPKKKFEHNSRPKCSKSSSQ